MYVFEDGNIGMQWIITNDDDVDVKGSNIKCSYKGTTFDVEFRNSDKKYTYQEAKEIFFDAIKQFPEDFQEKAKEVFNIVLEANKRAISMVKPGVRFCDIDNAAREYITDKGYGKYFTHRTGHSIGIETHDMGDVSSINTDILKPGMIFSVEPGIYLPGEFGVRIEDLVLVTQDGHEILNKHNKELTIIK